MPINGFQGEYRFLSNFWPCKVFFDGVSWPTVEHAYQAAKTVSADERFMIAQAQSPGEAKRRGRKVTLRPEWRDENFRIAIMKDLVRQKFKNTPELRTRLLETGIQDLVEANTWGDQFWGVSRGFGLNHLGMILMAVRKELMDEVAARSR